jgi:hypothetical protein
LPLSSKFLRLFNYKTINFIQGFTIIRAASGKNIPWIVFVDINLKGEQFIITSSAM